jgi:PAS domain S-box-containing protein
MTKLELTVSTSTFDCVSIGAKTASLLGVDVVVDPNEEEKEEEGSYNKRSSPAGAGGVGVHLSSLLADQDEFQELQQCIQRLLQEGRCRREEKNSASSSSSSKSNLFTTLNLVFVAPNADTLALVADRTPLDADGDVVSCSPVRAFHTCHQIHLACFVHVELLSSNNNDNDYDSRTTPTLFHLTAVEYSRQHRRLLIRNEFCAWLLEGHMESAVIATDPLGKVVFWNKFAETLYQWTSQEAIGKSIMDLTPSLMTQEQGVEIFSKLVQGEHWRGLFGVQCKDASQFMAHVTDTPVIDAQGNLKFVVGISDDYTQMHNLLEHLEREVELRTKQVLENERKANEADRRAEQAAAASKSKTEMIHMLSHVSVLYPYYAGSRADFSFAIVLTGRH